MIYKLEDRVLFDAALPADVAGIAVSIENAEVDDQVEESAVDASQEDASQADAPAEVQGEDLSSDLSQLLDATTQTDELEPSDPNEIYIIDSNVKSYEEIVDALPEDSEWYLLEADDSIVDIVEALGDRNDLDAIHILSHGTDGTLTLGTSELTADSLSLYKTELEAIGNSLSAEGDILLYGCDVARTEGGESFVNLLSQITNADVAASDDSTGFGGDWDLEFNAGIVEAASISMPGTNSDLVLSANNMSDLLSGADITDGTDGFTGNIDSAADLIKLSTDTSMWGSDKTYQLTADIDFSTANISGLDHDGDGFQYYDYVDWNGDGTIDAGDADGFDAIGRINGFSGKFDGHGYTIKGLYVNEPGVINNGGLFGIIMSSSEVSNVTLENANVTLGDYYGGVFAQENRGIVTDCSVVGGTFSCSYYSSGFIYQNTADGKIIDCSASNTIDVRGNGTSVGGLVSRNYGSISGSTFSGTINSIKAPVGGIVFSNNGGSISDCKFTGDINVSGAGVVKIGGIAAENLVDAANNGLIAGCVASGTITVADANTVGGLVGFNAASCTIIDSSSSVNLSSGATIGGLVGDNAGSIVRSFATGDIDGHSVLGGLVGENTGTIDYSYASGAVEATGGNPAGGLIGRNSGAAAIVRNSFATGSVTCLYNAGGLVGTGEGGGAVTNCYATGLVTGEFPGGLIGYNTATTVTDSYFIENNTIDTRFGVPGADSPHGTAVSAAAILQEATFNGFNFTEGGDAAYGVHWVIDEGAATPTFQYDPTTCTIDTTAVNQAEYVLSGATTAKGSLIGIYQNGNLIDSVFSDSATGNWSYTYDASSLAEGAYALTALHATRGEFLASTAAPNPAHSVIIDTTAPTIASIVRTDAAEITSSNAIDFTVTLNDAVSGFGASTLQAADFTINSAGVTHDANVTIAYVSGSTYIVSITNVAGDGTASITLNDGSFSDLAGNAYADGDITGASYTVDNTAPVISNVSTDTASPTNATSVEFTFDVADTPAGVDMSQFDITDFALVKTGTADGTISGVSYSGGTVTVTANSVVGDGTLELRILGTNIVDNVNNAAVDYDTGVSITIDNTAPSTPTCSLAESDVTEGTIVVVSGTATAGTTAHVYVDGVQVGTAAVVGTTWTYNLNTSSSSGTLDIQAAAADSAGNIGTKSVAEVLTVEALPEIFAEENTYVIPNPAENTPAAEAPIDAAPESPQVELIMLDPMVDVDPMGDAADQAQERYFYFVDAPQLYVPIANAPLSEVTIVQPPAFHFSSQQSGALAEKLFVPYAQPSAKLFEHIFDHASDNEPSQNGLQISDPLDEEELFDELDDKQKGLKGEDPEINFINDGEAVKTELFESNNNARFDADAYTLVERPQIAVAFKTKLETALDKLLGAVSA